MYKIARYYNIFHIQYLNEHHGPLIELKCYEIIQMKCVGITCLLALTPFQYNPLQVRHTKTNLLSCVSKYIVFQWTKYLSICNFSLIICRVWRYCTKNWPRENPHHYICYRSHTNLHVVHIQTWNSIPCDSHEVSRIHHRLCVVRSIEDTKCIK